MRIPGLSFVVVVLLAGCGGSGAFLNPDADMAFYETVAVAPFENLSGDVAAGAAVARVFRTHLWARGFQHVVSDGDWAKAEREVRGELKLDAAQPLPDDAIRQIGEILGAQGVFLGSVREYSMQRVGQDEFPLVAITLEFVDAASGSVVWDISLSERGGPKFPFFGFGETHTLPELTAKLCERAARDLRR